MKRFKAFIAILFAGIAVISATNVSAAVAQETKAYGTTTVTCVNNLNPIKDKAYSKITRNKNLPVDNYLSVTQSIQYQQGDNFYWTEPVEKNGTDVAKVEITKYRYSMFCNYTEFYASARGCDDYWETFEVPVNTAK